MPTCTASAPNAMAAGGACALVFSPVLPAEAELAERGNVELADHEGGAPRRQRIDDAPIKEVAVTDTINVPMERRPKGLYVLSVGELLAKAIRFTHAEQSVSSLFD